MGGVGGAVGGAVGGGVGTGGGVGPLVHAVPAQAKPQSHEQPEPSLNCAPGNELLPQNASGERAKHLVAQPAAAQSHVGDGDGGGDGVGASGAGGAGGAGVGGDGDGGVGAPGHHTQPYCAHVAGVQFCSSQESPPWQHAPSYPGGGQPRESALHSAGQACPNGESAAGAAAASPVVVSRAVFMLSAGGEIRASLKLR